MRNIEKVGEKCKPCINTYNESADIVAVSFKAFKKCEFCK